jgi:hypothetical protein
VACDRMASSGWCRSRAGRSERIRGREVKLCRGGGQEVAHSSEAPKPHGSSTSTRRLLRQVMYTFQKNGIMDAPSTNEEMVENWFIHSKLSSGR